ncbi:MAG: Fe-S cluster assembly protein SufD [Bacteroidota bacterium]|jgi:Fe-S cluster assembly protein SufD
MSLESNDSRLAKFMLHGGWPGSSVEAWKYTDLRAWLGPTERVAQESSKTYATTTMEHSLPSDLQPFSSPAMDLQALDPLGAASWALHRDGLDLELPAGCQPTEPLLISCLGRQAEGLHGFNHRLRLGAGSRLRVVQEIAPQNGRLDQTNSLPLPLASLLTLQVELGAGAELELIRWIRSETSTGILCQTDAVQAEGSKLHIYTIAHGGGLIRNNIHVQQQGDDAYTALYGLTMATAGGHADQYSRIQHAALRGQSHQHYKAVAAPSSSTVFNGVLRVEQDAQETNAFQKSSNLMLDPPGSGLPSGKVHAKPELQILADNVRCSHGATMGRLQEDAVFYLRSRGVPQDEARRILTLAFALEIVDLVPDENLRQQMQNALEALPSF